MQPPRSPGESLGLAVIRPLALSLLALVPCSGCGGFGDDSGPREAVPAETPGGWPVSFELPANAEPRFDRVVLVTLDTLRADHVSGYGYFRPTTPFLDTMAERGVLFERAMAAVSHTAPSHATILTGLVPLEHGIMENGQSLPDGAADLASLFGAAGFETAAFLSVGFLEGISGSFDHVRVDTQSSIPVLASTLRWLANERTSDRFFLWVHMYDSHRWKFVDRAPKDQLAAVRAGTELDDDALYDELVELHGLPGTEEGEPFDLPWTVTIRGEIELETKSERDYLDFIDTYDAQTRLADDLLARLYREVEGLGLSGSTLWVVTSDHGEGLASHGAAGHGSWIYQEQLWVPLVVHASDGSLARQRVSSLVQHVDLFPTLAATVSADLAGFDEALHGRSLWPLLEGRTEDWADRPAFSQRRAMEEDGPPEARADVPHNVGELFSLQTDTHKYLMRELGDDEFFDLEADALELENRIGTGAVEEEALRRLLESRVELYRSRGTGSVEQEIPSEWEEELRKLGYIE